MIFFPTPKEIAERLRWDREVSRRELRARLTAAALPSMPGASWEPEQIAKHAVAIADATIAELEKPAKDPTTSGTMAETTEHEGNT